MQKSVGFILRRCLALLLLTSLFVVANAQASEGGGGGGAYEKLEPFTVNLVDAGKVIQVVLTLKLAKPESGEKVKLFMPVIRHEMILLLSGKTSAQLESSAGKQRLIVETKAVANKAIELSPKEGVSDVLLESIIIQ